MVGVAMLEMLLVLALLGSGLSAMLKIYTYNELIWQRFISSYCAYLKDSEDKTQQRLRRMGIDVDWRTDWLAQCDQRVVLLSEPP